MGFNVNPVGNNKPVIRESHQTQDGGAGNLGYFQGNGEEKHKKEDKEKSIFDTDEDTFNGKVVLAPEDELSFDNIIKAIKKIFKKIFNLS